MNQIEGERAQLGSAAVIVNTRARRGEQAFAQAQDLLAKAGIPVQAAYPITDPARLPETVHEVLREGCDLVVLGGGDGTISSVVDFLADRDVVLGLLPLGTANDFARTLQLPTDIAGACQTIANGKIVDVDLGCAEGNYFVNVASVGLSVTVTEALSPWLKKRIGRMAYPLAAARAFFGHQLFTVQLDFPDGEHEPLEIDRVLQVAVGNGRFYGGGNLVAPGAGIDDAALDVYVIRVGRWHDIISVARTFRSGDFVHAENVIHLTTGRVVVTTDPTLAVNIDGEIVAQTPQEFTVARNALRVLIPEHATPAILDT